MSKKVETVFYCDECEKSVDEDSVALHVSANCPPQIVNFAPSANLHVFEKKYQDGLLCQDCLAYVLGFDGWDTLQRGIRLVAEDDKRRNRRTDL